MITPTAQELVQAQQAIEAHLIEVRSHPDQRAGAHPYALCPYQETLRFLLNGEVNIGNLETLA